jgi:hypothetical protein
MTKALAILGSGCHTQRLACHDLIVAWAICSSQASSSQRSALTVKRIGLSSRPAFPAMW